MGRAERSYARSLSEIARHIGDLVKGFDPSVVNAMPTLGHMLLKYAELLKPWAHATAERMIKDVEGGERSQWLDLGNAISHGLRQEILRAPVGERMRQLLAQQVDLITSLPRQAANRVHDLTVYGMLSSMRSAEIAAEIMRTGVVTESRAKLIARTEVSRTHAVLNQARSEYIGSTHYIWRTMLDGAVREGHRHMEGKTCQWANPPAVNENGRIMNHHPGQIWNCRCYAEPIVDDPYAARPGRMS